MLKRRLDESTVVVALLASAISIYVFEDYLSLRNAYLFKDIGSDSINSIYPELRFTAEYLRTEGFPAWSFQHGMGQRMNSQSIGDPFNLILMLFGSGLGAAIGAVEALKLVLCGVVFALYLGVLGASPFTRIVGGLLYAFCGFTVIGSGWHMFSREALYLALLLFAFEKYLQDRNALFLPAVVALVGMSQIFDLYLFALLLCGYASLRILERRDLRLSRSLGLATRVGLLAALGVAMSSVLLSSGILEIMQSPRVGGEVSLSRSLWSTPILDTISLSRLATSVARLFSNDLLGTGSDFRAGNYLGAPAYYCGLVTLLLVPQSLALARPRQRVLIGCLLLTSITPAIFEWFRFAFWGFTGDYYRLFSLFVSLTLLYPALQVLEALKNGRRPHLPVLLISLITYVSVLLILDARRTLDDEILLRVIAFLVVEALILGSMWIEEAQRFARPLLALVVVVELAVLSHPAANARSVLTLDELAGRDGYNDHTIDAIDYLRAGDDTFYRVSKGYWSGPAEFRSHNDAKLQGFYGTATYHSFNQGSYVSFLSAMGKIEPGNEYQTRWIDGLGAMPLVETWSSVKYRLERLPMEAGVGANDTWRIRSSTYRERRRFGNIVIFENTRFLPLGFSYDAYFPSQDFHLLDEFQREIVLLEAAVIDEGHPAAQVLRRLDRDALPGRHELLAHYDRQVAERRESTLQVTHHSHNKIHGTIRLDQPRVLFFSIPFDPGWHVQVDGEDVKPFQVAIGFTGILLDSGDHKVALDYRIPYFLPSLAVSITALFVYGWLIWATVRARTSSVVRFFEPPVGVSQANDRSTSWVGRGFG